MKNLIVTKQINEGLKSIRIFYPRTNKQESALYCTTHNVVLNIDVEPTQYPTPYHPMGGSSAIDQIIEGGGLVLGCEVIGLNCYNCYGDVYRLGEKPEMI